MNIEFEIESRANAEDGLPARLNPPTPRLIPGGVGSIPSRLIPEPAERRSCERLPAG